MHGATIRIPNCMSRVKVWYNYHYENHPHSETM